MWFTHGESEECQIKSLPIDTESQVLILQKRTNVTKELDVELKRVVSGQSGENEFLFKLKDSLKSSPKIITDFRFMYENSECQIDCLLIYQNEIVIIEVKNYQSDFYYEEGRWFLSHNTKEISSPLEQVSRAARLLRNLLDEKNTSMTITPFIVFINPKFLLYGAPRDARIIFPNRLDRLFDLLDKKIDYPSPKTHKIEKVLRENQMIKSRFSNAVKVEKSKIKSGVTCPTDSCDEFMQVERRQFVCGGCGIRESIEDSVIRMTRDYKTLFPQDKIRATAIESWMGHSISLRTVQRILMKHFKRVGISRSTEYLLEE